MIRHIEELALNAWPALQTLLPHTIYDAYQHRLSSKE